MKHRKPLEFYETLAKEADRPLSPKNLFYSLGPMQNVLDALTIGSSTPKGSPKVLWKQEDLDLNI